MAQEFHNFIGLVNNQEQRQKFLADALRLRPQWCWDWVKIDFNAGASSGGDSGKSRLDFYTRGAPDGLDELMRLHPKALLECHFLDLSAPHLYVRKLHDNVVLEESEEEVPASEDRDAWQRWCENNNTRLWNN